MNDKNININVEPKLPEMFVNARRNHGGQQVPQYFFSQFEKKMNAAIDADVVLRQAEKKVAQPQIKWYNQRRTWMSLAASFVLIVVLGIAFQFDYLGHKLSEKTQDSATSMAEMQYETGDEYLEVPEIVEESYLATTNDYELYDFFCEI